MLVERLLFIKPTLGHFYTSWCLMSFFLWIPLWFLSLSLDLTTARWWRFSIYHSTRNYHSLQSRFQNTTWRPWLSAAVRCGSQGYRFAPIWTAWQHTGKPFCRHMPHLWPKPACSMGHTRSQVRSAGNVNSDHFSLFQKVKATHPTFEVFTAPAF